MVYLLALGSAFSNALTSILQRMGVEDAPKDSRLKLSLMTYALRRGIWILGFLLMVVSFIMQAVALHFGRLTEVQPILTTELLFLVLLLATWLRFRVGLREWVGVLAAAAGLAGFLEFAQPGGGNLVPDPWDWALVSIPCVVGIVVSVALAMRGPRWWRAAMFGTAAAIGFAFTASLTKIVSDVAAKDWTALFSTWETYALAVSGIASVFLTQNAYHAGPIAASQSTLVLVDPLASIVIGVGLFGDTLRTSGYWGPLEALSLVVMFAGAISVAQSPLVSGVKGEGDEGEKLALRSRSRRLNKLLSNEAPISPLPHP
jgi:drug/metabolite transporter (DMT)-like permease